MNYRNRRVNREIQRYWKQNQNPIFFYIDHNDNNDYYENICFFECLIDNCRPVKVCITHYQDYPFKPPRIQIINVWTGKHYDYIDLLKLQYEWVKYFNVDKCLCCNSILCKWNVTHDMLSILKEIEKNLKIKSRLLDIISTRSVIRQKIGFYVPIETYL